MISDSRESIISACRYCSQVVGYRSLLVTGRRGLQVVGCRSWVLSNIPRSTEVPRKLVVPCFIPDQSTDQGGFQYLCTKVSRVRVS